MEEHDRGVWPRETALALCATIALTAGCSLRRAAVRSGAEGAPPAMHRPFKDSSTLGTDPKTVPPGTVIPPGFGVDLTSRAPDDRAGRAPS